MGLLRRLRERLHLLAARSTSRAATPSDQLTPLDASLATLERRLDEVRRAVSTARADGRQLRDSVEARRSEAREARREAEEAVRAGDDDRAGRALLRRADLQATERSDAEALERHGKGVALLEDGLRELTSRVERLRRERNLLAARAVSAETRRALAEELGHGARDATARASSARHATDSIRLDEIERAVEALESEASLALDLADDLDPRATGRTASGVGSTGGPDARH